MTIPSARKQTSSGWMDDFANGYSTAGPKTRLIVGLLVVGSVGISIISSPGPVGILGAALALLMLTIAFIDRQRFIIPNELTGAGLALALVHAALLEPNAIPVAVAIAVVRGAVLASVILLIRYIYRRLRGREGIGLGDVKLAGVAGAWLDWSFMPIVVEIAACTALLVYLVRQYAFGRPVSATTRLPFGLFFAPAIWFCWFLETTLLT